MPSRYRSETPLAACTALLFQVGGEAFALPLPSGEAPDLQQIGTLANLPVWAVVASPAEAQRHARLLARKGRLGLVFAVEPSGPRWFIAVTVPPVRPAIVPNAAIDALPLIRLTQATRMIRDTPLEQALAFADALDVDAAGRRTFRLLRELLDRGVALLPPRVSLDDRHAWVLAQITRLLFLRFVESEGWLDGNPRFLADAFDRCLTARRDPTRHLLQPLFFGTLNRRIDDRSRFASQFGAIPFLNGGLFEPHAIERAHKMQLPTAYWCDAFAALVDRVDVTLNSDPHDGRVTPEMLGRVFEGALEPAERRQQGAFFTPPTLVDALLREAIACHLAPTLGRSEDRVAEQLDDPDPELQRVLLDLNVLDPAVGSGAFLVGALALLHGPGTREPARVRHLVTRRLFGVDRHPGAVRLCELRLWLEVLRAMRGRPANRVLPLPNLDAQIRAGDALLDPLGTIALDRIAARRLRHRQRAILGAHGADKRLAISAARRTERAAIVRALQEQEGAADREIAELLAAARAPTLFGDRPRIDPSLRRDLDYRRRQRADLRTERRRLLRDASSAPFALTAAFAPVMATRGGFDLVVGNPPWVRAERLPRTTREALSARYRWWRSGTGSGWQHLPDLAVAFIERGFTLLAPGGTMVLLVPAKIATAGYATACRSALAHRATIHRFADLGADPRAGFDATTYPLGLIATRQIPTAGHAVRIGLGCDGPPQPQLLWQSSSAWAVGSPAIQRIATRLQREHPLLSETVRPQLGVKTGANAVFVDPPASCDEWTRPAVRARDVSPFVANARARLLWPADARGNPWRILPPPLVEYFAPHEATLRRRADQQDGPWWQLFRTRAATAEHRVIWRDLASELQATVLRDGTAVPLNSCYVAALPSAIAAESLSAWLNSTPIRALARLIAEPAAGGFARFAARAIEGLPLPRHVLGHPVLASMSLAASDRDVQEALDECVSELLGLTPDERDVIRGLATHRR